MPGSRALAQREMAALSLVVVLLGVTACSRTGLGGLVTDDLGGGASGTLETLDASTPSAAPPSPSASGSAAPPSPSASGSAAPPSRGSRCTPTAETCNRKDDDCNGKIDDGLPPIPCAGGGEQYCVAGRYSACPERCETCVPGTERVCFLSYCTFWATETCADDGRSFGTCREGHVPPECADVASAHKDSAKLEQCCIDTGHCCHDEFDLDGDGDHDEMLGQCDEVSCHP